MIMTVLFTNSVVLFGFVIAIGIRKSIITLQKFLHQSNSTHDYDGLLMRILIPKIVV